MLRFLALLLASSIAYGQLVEGVSRISRADLTVSLGDVVYLSAATNNGIPAQHNRVYTDGTFWEGDDSFPSEFSDGKTAQIVTVSADVASTSATYLTVTGRQAQYVYACRDDSSTVAHATALSGWQDTALDITHDGATFSCLVKGFPKGAYNVPGNNGDARQYILFVRNQTSPVSVVPTVPGSLRFADASYTVNESDTLTFRFERYGGTSGACTATISETGGASNAVLNTTSVSFSDGEGGVKTGTATPADVSGNQSYTIGLSSFSGCAEGNRSSVSATIVDEDVTPSAQQYYVNPTDGNCSAGNDGESRTYSSGTAGPWCTNATANAVQAVAGGDVEVFHEVGEYVDDPIIPQFSGSDLTHKIIHKCIGTGTVLLTGNSAGSLENAVSFSSVSFVDIRSNTGCDWKYDGEVVHGSGGGQVPKGGEPEDFAHITKGMLVDGTDIVVELTGENTGGYRGVNVSSSNADRVSMLINVGIHGTPHYSDGFDFGDTIYVDSDVPTDHRFLFDGQSGGTLVHGGHRILNIRGGTGILRVYEIDNEWSGIGTFTSGWGNGAFAINRNAYRWQFHDLVINRTGQANDQTYVDGLKFEGRQHTAHDIIIRNSDHDSIRMEAGGHTNWYASGLHLSHFVIEHAQGPAFYCRDYGADANGGSFGGFSFKNGIIRNVATNPNFPSWTDEIIHCNFISSNPATWSAYAPQFHGITVEHATKDCTQLYITLSGDGAPGKQTIQWWLNNHPTLYSNWDCTSDANLDNAPAAGSDQAIADYATDYLPVSDTLSIAKGVNLALATNSGSNSTNLCIDRAGHFTDPKSFDDPTGGQSSGGYGVHIAGEGNVGYTARSITTWPAGCLTLDTASDWSIGTPVNLPITSGSTPNRGAVR